MKLWIDNTGLHTAARCLDGQASRSHDYEIRSLLQLATLIIFGTKITFNGFEDKALAERSEEILDQLHALGITDDIISVQPTSEAEYALACQTTAESVSRDLEEIFNPAEYDVLGVAPPEAPRALHERQFAYMSLVDDPTPLALRRAMKEALKVKAPGAVEYMMACSKALREAVRRTKSRHLGWNEAASYQLNIFLRYHLNDALADQAFSKYAPAIGRAELIEGRNQYILNAIGNITDQVVTDLRGKPLGVPSTLAALLQRSKGEPRAILAVAREFREYSGIMRQSLTKLAEAYPSDTPESRFDLQREVTEIGKQLRRAVGLEKASTLRDAVEVRIVLALPFPSVSVMKVVDWLRDQRQNRRVAVLTELVRASAYSDLSTALYRRLCDSCRKNAS